jgi:hypothetical protein
MISFRGGGEVTFVGSVTAVEATDMHADVVVGCTTVIGSTAGSCVVVGISVGTETETEAKIMGSTADGFASGSSVCGGAVAMVHQRAGFVLMPICVLILASILCFICSNCAYVYTYSISYCGYLPIRLKF